jgi:hypothetical protein
MKMHTALRPLALALLGAGIAAPVFAGEPIEFENGYKLDWRVNSTYTLSTRLENQDPKIAANTGGNDGNNNFDKGSLTANRLSLLFDTSFTNGRNGLVLSASTFYDDVYHRTNDNAGPVNKPGAVDEFTRDARRFHGGYTRLLDAYVFNTFDLGEGRRANVRFGRHVVSWGEGLFFPSISLAQGPADGTKTGIVGTETKDQLLPEDQVSTQIEMSPKWSLLGHLQFGFHTTIAPAPGSYLSAADSTGPGGTCLQPYRSVGGRSVCSYGVRGNDIDPGNTPQWGVGSRYRITDETEVGLYYLNYHDRSPLPVINAFNATSGALGGGAYNVRYFDNIKLIGATYSTSVGAASIAAEVSYKQGAPVLVKTLVNPRAPQAASSYLPTPTRGEILQANLNAIWNLERTALADQTTLTAEVAYVTIGSIEAINAPGAASATVFPKSKDLFFGANYGLAASGTLSLGYPGIFEGWDLSIPISLSRQLKGRTITGGVGGEGDMRASIGATFTYQRNLQVGLTYMGYFGDAEVVNQREFRALTDRDQLSLVMKYSF